jgi:hypothetical protein
MMSTRRRAVSLIELVMAVSIVVALTLAGGVSMRGLQTKKQSKAAAEILAEGLRYAGMRARALGYPVAVVLPTDFGRTQFSQGYYHAEGEVAASPRKGYDFKAEMPEVAMFCGTYAGPTWTPPLATASRGSQFSFDEWLPPIPSDACIVFLPSGEVVANHSATAGSYRIVLGTRMSATAPVPGPDPHLPPESDLTGVCDPHTVVISTQGQVEVVPGLLDGAPGLVHPKLDLPRPDVAQAPYMTGRGNRPSELVAPKLVIDPDPNRQVIPVVAPVGTPTVVMGSATAGPQQVSFTFYARDPDADPLSAEWTSSSDPPGAVWGNGTWSTPRTRMRWSYSHHAWYRTSTWTAPDTAPINSRFVLRCVLRDDRGGELRPSARSVIGYPGATADGFDVSMINNLALAFRSTGGELKSAPLTGEAPSTILSSSGFDASDPGCLTWFTGLTYRKGMKPKFMPRLNSGDTPETIGSNDVNFGGTELRGLAVRGDRLYGLVVDGPDWKVQSLPAPPVGGNVTLNTTLTFPIGTGNFSRLLAGPSAANTLLACDGAGNYVAIWLSATPAFKTVSGPPLSEVQLDLMGGRLCGTNTNGEVTLCNLTWNSGTKTLSFGPTVVCSEAGCAAPTIAPNGNYVAFKNASGNATIYNLNTSENATLPLTDVREMVWGHE